MIEDLEITNGVLNKKFNTEEYNYEVSVEEDVTTLTFNLQKSDDLKITYYGNDKLTCGEGHVYLEYFNGSEVITYSFLVNKSCTKNVISYKQNEDTKYVMDSNIRLPLIGCCCFILIIIIFLLIFRRK